MEKQEAKNLLKKNITVIGGPSAVDSLVEGATGAIKFVEKYSTVAGSTEAIDTIVLSQITDGDEDGVPTTKSAETLVDELND